jgi:hypothetical protein
MTGTVCLLGAGWYATQLPAIKKVMRPIYVEMGILPAPPEAGRG